MIELDLNAADEEILAIARAQTDVYKANAKKIDRQMEYGPDYRDHLKPPGAEKLVHVRDLAKSRADELSGLPIIEALIYLEENSGHKPLYFDSHEADMLSVALSDKLIKLAGTPEQYDRWKDRYYAWGMSEPGAGSDPASMRTTAVLDEATNEWVINGEKTFISNGGSADGVMVMCRCVTPAGDTGISPVIVDRGTAGFSIGPQMEKLGLRNWDTVSLAFQDCRVPADHRIEGSLKDALSIFNTTRGIIGAQALGFARAALDVLRGQLAAAGIAVDYAGDANARPAIVDRLMRMEALYDGAYLSILHAKWFEQENGPDKFHGALAKMKGGLIVRKIVTECMSLLGPESSSERHHLEQLFRDSRILDIYEGPNEAQKLILGRTLLGYNAKELN